jgi:hypothetical protein
MIGIAITVEAFEAIARTLPVGGYEAETSERGGVGEGDAYLGGPPSGKARGKEGAQ